MKGLPLSPGQSGGIESLSLSTYNTREVVDWGRVWLAIGTVGLPWCSPTRINTTRRYPTIPAPNTKTSRAIVLLGSNYRPTVTGNGQWPLTCLASLIYLDQGQYIWYMISPIIIIYAPCLYATLGLRQAGRDFLKYIKPKSIYILYKQTRIVLVRLLVCQ